MSTPIKRLFGIQRPVQSRDAVGRGGSSRRGVPGRPLHG
jgi:hypothetical protein